MEYFYTVVLLLLLKYSTLEISHCVSLSLYVLYMLPHGMTLSFIYSTAVK